MAADPDVKSVPGLPGIRIELGRFAMGGAGRSLILSNTTQLRLSDNIYILSSAPPCELPFFPILNPSGRIYLQGLLPPLLPSETQKICEDAALASADESRGLAGPPCLGQRGAGSDPD